jgi:phage terminase large subunit
MTNEDISREMELAKVLRFEFIYPDPNEPKSMEELRLLGWNIGKTVSGAGSVAFGIKKVNSYYQHWTKDSIECIKDQRNYKYITRREAGTGREYLSDNTTHQYSHGNDSRRYGVASYVPGRRTSLIKRIPL